MQTKKPILPLLFLTFCVGCGGTNVQISGKVTYPDGEPMPGGTICFDNGTTSAIGHIQGDGTYTLGSLKPRDGIPKGMYAVYFMGTKSPGTDPKSGREGVLERVSPKFKSSSTSGLQYEVTGRATGIDFIVDYPLPTGFLVTPLEEG